MRTQQNIYLTISDLLPLSWEPAVDNDDEGSLVHTEVQNDEDDDADDDDSQSPSHVESDNDYDDDDDYY